ncbi:MAG: methyltransferase domain-containing protein [Planctomyces sp.]
MSTDKSAMKETISDFGSQWTRFDDIDSGYYGREILFDDILKPLVAAEDVAGKVVADIGSGTGRIVRMLASAGAAKIFAIEPSEAISVLRRNVAGIRQIECLHVDGASLPCEPALDWVFSIGVIHHIPDAKQVMSSCFRALKPRGRVAIWLYGREGNELYLCFVLPLRRVLRCCPDLMLTALSWFAVPMLRMYGWACRWMSLPMRTYFVGHISKLSSRQVMVTVFDQLNPAYAKYYTKSEAIELLEQSGFVDVQVHHRHGYSWTVVGRKP